MSNTNTNVIFKNYSNNQMMLLPPSLEDLITENHPVKLVNQVIDQIKRLVLIETASFKFKIYLNDIFNNL